MQLENISYSIKIWLWIFIKFSILPYYYLLFLTSNLLIVIYSLLCLGHNGLVAAGYLQKAGYNVCVLEKRHVIGMSAFSHSKYSISKKKNSFWLTYVTGGCAVTEEIVPGFKFSRASYLLSLLRPQIIDELELKVDPYRNIKWKQTCNLLHNAEIRIEIAHAQSEFLHTVAGKLLETGRSAFVNSFQRHWLQP